MYAKDPTTFYNAYPNLFNSMRHPIRNINVSTPQLFEDALKYPEFSKQFTFIIEQ
jgi:hypothetical protein